jgi:twitching motility protein PilT
MAALDELFEVMVREGASDLHISSGYPPFFRIHGHMIKINSPALTPEKCKKLIFETMSAEQSQIFERKMELDWSYQLPEVARFRANAFIQIDGYGAV